MSAKNDATSSSAVITRACERVIADIAADQRCYPHLTDILGLCIEPLAHQRSVRVSGVGDDVAHHSVTSDLRERLALDSVTQVCVVVVDGLGYDMMMARMGHAPLLRRYSGDIIEARTVIPSTTAAAITASTTGAMPGRTRMVGWSVYHRGHTGILLSFDGITTPPQLWQPVPTWFERLREHGIPSAVISSPRFAQSGLTGAALRGARYIGAETLDERIDATIVECVNRRTPLVYLYWSELDHAGHRLGWQHPVWTAELEALDTALNRLCRAMPPHAALILTADHGMVDTTPADCVDIARIPALGRHVTALAGEARSLHIHTEEGMEAEVLSRWHEHLGDIGVVIPAADAHQLIGEGDGASLIGAGLFFPHGSTVVGDSSRPDTMSLHLTGVHGGLTHAERAIPIVRLH